MVLVASAAKRENSTSSRACFGSAIGTQYILQVESLSTLVLSSNCEVGLSRMRNSHIWFFNSHTFFYHHRIHLFDRCYYHDFSCLGSFRVWVRFMCGFVSCVGLFHCWVIFIYGLGSDRANYRLIEYEPLMVALKKCLHDRIWVTNLFSATYFITLYLS